MDIELLFTLIWHVCFEFLENDKISSVNSNGNDVLHLTVPIVTESITEEEARNNPRVSREKMLEFIEGDSDKAEEDIFIISVVLRKRYRFGMYLWFESTSVYVGRRLCKSKRICT